MKNHSLSTKGLSLSQAQSISNLCNQRATEIGYKLSNVNNYSKTVSVGKKDRTLVVGKPLPENVLTLLTEKAELHACQAFLMENMKAKEAKLVSAKKISPDLSEIKRPEIPKFVDAKILGEVNEVFGWEQLTAGENAEYLEAEAYASHIGQFIHKGSTLDSLRSELPDLPAIEWMTIKDGIKSPIEIKIHHTSEYLLTLHEELAGIHRGYEQKVNYFKAKVKNLTTAENARIANINADEEAKAENINNDLRAQYDSDMKKFNADIQALKLEFEKKRQESIKEIAALRIDIHPRFQKVIDIFLKQLPDNQE